MTDGQLETTEPLLPSNVSKRDRTFESTRRMVEGTVYRYRYGIAWRDLPRERFGPWQSVWKRRRRYPSSGHCDQRDPDIDQPIKETCLRRISMMRWEGDFSWTPCRCGSLTLLPHRPECFA
nr:transposase [Brevibacterium permense]